MTELFILAIAAVVIWMVVVVPVAFIVVSVTWIQRRRGALMAAVTAASLILLFAASPLPRIGAFALYAALPPARPILVRADLAMSRAAREEVVRQALDHDLPPGDWPSEYVLPVGASGLSVDRTVYLIEDCGPEVFFLTLTGFSPDPYAGFEYVPAGCTPEPDPLGSGQGITEDLGDGWYWIQAR